jgi:hypothetical protein
MLSPTVLRLLTGPPEWAVLGTVRWEVRFDHLTLLRLEDATGLDVLGGKLDIVEPNARTLRALIQVTLWEGGPVDWAKLIPATIHRMMAGFQRAWVRDMPVREPSRADGPGGKPTAETWIEAWANAREILGLSDEEWLSYTPRMVQTLSKLRLESVRQNEWMLAQIAANVVNWSMHPPRTVVKAESFMLHPWDLPEAKQAPQTAEGVLKMFREFGGMDLAGKIAIDQLIN